MLDVAQVATRCGVSPETIRRDINAGLLVAFDFGSKRRPLYRIEESSVDGYLERLKVRHRRSQFTPGRRSPEDGLDDEIETRGDG